MSDSVIKIEAVDEQKFMETLKLAEETDDSSKSTINDADAEADPAADAEADPAADAEADPVSDDREVSSTQIPQEIIFFDILARVPVKSLIQFTLVSRDWNSLIRGDYDFIKRQFRHSLTRPEWACFLVLVKGVNPYNIKFLTIGDPDGGTSVREILRVSTALDYVITQNVYGLSCFHPVNGLMSDDYSYAYVSCHSLSESYHLPTNPTMLQASYSFGVDPLTLEFKVLSFHTNHHIRRNHEIEVNKFYIIGNDDGLWRQISPVLPFDIVDIGHSILFGQGSEGVCVDGIIHWILFSKWTILTFSLRDDTFGVMSLPDDLVPQEGVFRGPFRLIRVGGYLAIEAQRTITPNLKILWILKEYENRLWVKKCIFIPYIMDLTQWSLKLLSSAHIDTLFLALVPVHGHAIQHVMYCNLEAESLKWIHLPQLPPGDEVRVVTTYAESLLSLQDQ